MPPALPFLKKNQMIARFAQSTTLGTSDHFKLHTSPALIFMTLTDITMLSILN